MAKKGGSGKNYTSQGKHSNVSKSTLRGMRAMKSEADKLLDKQSAWMKGHNPWVTIANPNKSETDKLFIRVRYNDIMRGSYRDLRKKAIITK
jgi:hypothetical protein